MFNKKCVVAGNSLVFAFRCGWTVSRIIFGENRNEENEYIHLTRGNRRNMTEAIIETIPSERASNISILLTLLTDVKLPDDDLSEQAKEQFSKCFTRTTIECT